MNYSRKFNTFIYAKHKCKHSEVVNTKQVVVIYFTYRDAFLQCTKLQK